MQVGSLVSWETAGGEYELGVVVSVTCLSEEGRVLVFFPQDGCNSFITIDELKLLSI